MTVLELQLPDDIEEQLRQMPGDVQAFILDAVRHQLRDNKLATDEDIEAATVADLTDDILTAEELTYYLNLPDVQAR